MEPSEPGGSSTPGGSATPNGSATPDDWTPWATPEPPPAGAGDDATAATATTATAAAVTARPTPVSRRRTAVAPVGPAPSPSTFSAGGVAVVLGAGIAIGGTFLNMVKVTAGINKLRTVTTFTTTYFDNDRGKLVAGIAALVLVIALIGMLRAGSNLVPAILTGLGGLAVFGISLYDRLDLDNYTQAQLNLLRHNPYRGLFEATTGPALYVCMGGGVVIVIGSIMAALRK